MNRDEIKNMQPGRELDALVAERVMGLKIPNRHNARFYSTELDAAWEVEEKLFQMDKEIVIRYIKNLATVVGTSVHRLLQASTLQKLIHASASDRCKSALLSLIQEDTP